MTSAHDLFITRLACKVLISSGMHPNGNYFLIRDGDTLLAPAAHSIMAVSYQRTVLEVEISISSERI